MSDSMFNVKWNRLPFGQSVLDPFDVRSCQYGGVGLAWNGDGLRVRRLFTTWRHTDNSQRKGTTFSPANQTLSGGALVEKRGRNKA
jgi:hypothetical protein